MHQPINLKTRTLAARNSIRPATAICGRFGNFYGATVHGGDNDDGSIYKFTP
jgi:hypothetical protein